MSKVNVFEVKAKLSEYLDRAARGERIVICRHNKPVAELRAIAEALSAPRRVGPIPGRPTFDVPPSFFEALPADELEQWDGVVGRDPLSAGLGAPKSKPASRVAESRQRDAPARKTRTPRGRS